MQYMLLIYENEAFYAEGPEGEAWKTVVAAHEVFGAELTAAGAMRGGAGLRPTSTATTVRRRGDGERTVHDGPFAETKEQLGGFYLIEAPDLDHAIAWARKLPLGADGSVEIRPVEVM